MKRQFWAICAVVGMGALAACGGGANGGSAPMSPSTPHSNQQVVLIALPTSAMGYQASAYGTIGGYTQQASSQVLGFVPGQQVMLKNAQANGQGAPPHTLGDTGSQSFVGNPPLTTTPSGGTTLAPGFQSGTIAPGASIGPVTLTAGTYYIGCAYHYTQYGMRDVLIVAPDAGPGPQATPPPGQSPPPSGGGYGY